MDLVLHKKALDDPDTVKGGLKVPPEPMELYRKARSARAGTLAREGRLEAAITLLQDLVSRGIASTTDRRTLARLLHPRVTSPPPPGA